jgi:hypothetical protein
MAITIALSPERIRSKTMMLRKLNRKSASREMVPS